MRYLFVDIETYSGVDLKKSGLYKYAQPPDFQILLIGYAWEDGPVQMLDMTRPEAADSQELLTLRCALLDPGVVKHAYNAPFEWYCLNSAGLTTSLNQWRCAMLHGLYCGYTAGLAATSAAMGLPEDMRKASTGRALIRTFCVPRTPTQGDPRTRVLPHHEPERWRLFLDYCAQDVVAEREIVRRLAPWPVPDDEFALWLLDQKINAAGVAVDSTLIEGALTCDSETTYSLKQEAREITGLDNPASVAQLKDWLASEMDEEITKLTKEEVARLLVRTDDEAVKRVLQIRRELAKTSVKKFVTMRAMTCADGRIRGLLQFYGANRTGRWAGRGVQVQNLPRNYLSSLDLARNFTRGQKTNMLRLVYGNVPDTLSQLTRTAFVPSPGCRLIVADYSAIEARVIAWMAGETWRNEVFATHGKIYEASAAAMFGVPIEHIVKGREDYALRQKGKVAELALGYGGASDALIAMGALSMGLKEEELEDIKNRWRAASKHIVGYWYAVEGAALETMRTGRQSGANGVLFTRECDTAGQDFITLRLPSGRKLFYAQPYLAPNKFGKEALHYRGVNQKSGKWEQFSTWGGKLVENIVQATARDCLAVALTRLDAAGYSIAFHVHDEVVIDALPHQTLEEALGIMRQSISWADGLMLNADGFEAEYYRKD